MNQTKRIGLLAALFLAAVAPACGHTVDAGSGETGGGGTGGTGGTNDGGGCQDPASCTPSCPQVSFGLEGSPCPVEGQVCSERDECGYGPEAECLDGEWWITYYDPAGAPCCGADCAPEPCPDEAPVNGSACDVNYSGCQYLDPICGDLSIEASCNGSTWYVSNNNCPLNCPATLPVAGTPCFGGCCSTGTCAYLDANGCPATMLCMDGVWVVNSESCTPSSACATLDMSQCGSTEGCRWLEWMPLDKCGQLQEGGFPKGCYPVEDCASDADCNGGTCTAVEVDPCPAGDCNTCADHAQICVP
ncbi:hypothetical protein [Polyangium sp. y55x31]|uniref:hypothetical protein n=1 Tax=Polyangium sp. y55x31 TaxID=3042688 RepID=UPI002482C4A2|nr:hypothetical protein [Polyangium sp. y55x31]MDI1484541.1 hypothetical protein [Polyangium sp. y55x31]